ncbi:hypothetical protein H0H93_002942 [Arthromyces matolae]|nr:hypothetical protein H0H93_002942 [Arthromyces matolae]
MGSLCSKPGNYSGGHHVLGSQDGSNPAASSSSDPRTAAAEAAERRFKAAQARGTNASNPKQGQLAAKAGKISKTTTDSQQEERLVVSNPFQVHILTS